MVTIQFEVCDREIFAHIWSTTGVLGNARQLQMRIPVGVWVTLDTPRLRRLTPWLVKKCGFVHRATLTHEGKLVDVLRKV